MVVQRRARWAAQAAPSAGAHVYGVFKEKGKKKPIMKCTYVRQLHAHTNTARVVFASPLDASAVQAHILSELKQEHFTCKYRSIQTD